MIPSHCDARIVGMCTSRTCQLVGRLSLCCRAWSCACVPAGRVLTNQGAAQERAKVPAAPARVCSPRVCRRQSRASKRLTQPVHVALAGFQATTVSRSTSSSWLPASRSLSTASGSSCRRLTRTPSAREARAQYNLTKNDARMPRVVDTVLHGMDVGRLARGGPAAQRHPLSCHGRNCCMQRERAQKKKRGRPARQQHGTVRRMTAWRRG